MKTKKILSLLAVLFLIFLVLQNGCKKDQDEKPIPTPTPSSNTFSVTFGGEKNDVAYSIQETSEGGYIIAGSTDQINNKGNRDAWVIKLNSTGNLSWEKTYGNGKGYAKCIKETLDGGYIITGQYWEDGQFLWLFKINMNGEIIWEQEFGGSVGNHTVGNVGKDVKQTMDGGYIIAGSTKTFASAGWEDIWIIKTDSKGIIEWETILGEGGPDGANSVDFTTDGGYVILAEKSPSIFGDSYSCLIKLGSNGELIWMRNYEESSTASSVKLLIDGGYVITGAADLPFWNLRLFKVDSIGNMVWEKLFEGYDVNAPCEVEQTEDGGFILFGTKVIDDVNSDFWLLKTDSNGNFMWGKTYNGINKEWAYSGQQTADGGYIMAGGTYLIDKSNWDLLVIKTDSLGNQ